MRFSHFLRLVCIAALIAVAALLLAPLAEAHTPAILLDRLHSTQDGKYHFTPVRAGDPNIDATEWVQANGMQEWAKPAQPSGKVPVLKMTLPDGSVRIIEPNRVEKTEPGRTEPLPPPGYAKPVATQPQACPNGRCPKVIYAPQPLYRAPVCEAINRAGRAVYEFMTPQGHIVQGYLVRPVEPITRERALRNAAYWQEQAAKLPK